MSADIYIASSWKNKHQEIVVQLIKKIGLIPYDFKDPKFGFNWNQIDPNWHDWTFAEYKHGLSNSLAEKGYQRDFDAMVSSKACILVMPAGRSACLEAGWMIGQQKPCLIYCPERVDADLMFKLAGDSNIVNSLEELAKRIMNWKFGKEPIFDKAWFACPECGEAISANQAPKSCKDHSGEENA